MSSNYHYHSAHVANMPAQRQTKKLATNKTMTNVLHVKNLPYNSALVFFFFAHYQRLAAANDKENPTKQRKQGRKHSERN